MRLWYARMIKTRAAHCLETTHELGKQVNARTRLESICLEKVALMQAVSRGSAGSECAFESPHRISLPPEKIRNDNHRDVSSGLGQWVGVPVGNCSWNWVPGVPQGQVTRVCDDRLDRVPRR